MSFSKSPGLAKLNACTEEEFKCMLAFEESTLRLNENIQHRLFTEESVSPQTPAEVRACWSQAVLRVENYKRLCKDNLLLYNKLMMSKRGQYCTWDVTEMEMALNAMERGDMGLNAAAKFYGIPKATLSRHAKCQNKIANEATKFHGGQPTLPKELEDELVQHCMNLEAMFFGLTMDELRSSAFDLAEKNRIQHSFSKEKQVAGKKWYYSFMHRHPELSLRQPENTSLARAQGFNKPRVEAFFSLLEKIYDREKLTPDRLYNMDETNLSTVQDGQRKIIGERGKRQIGGIVSNERGESSTCVVAVSATGNYVPPMVIYRRKRMKEELGTGGPAGAVYTCQEKGWMSNEGFCTWLEHFIK